MSVTRQEVYDAIDGERDYQERRWNRNTTASEGLHTVSEWIVYMQDYMTQAINQVSRHPEPQASQMALETIRKITTMGVCCMEQNGAPKRQGT